MALTLVPKTRFLILPAGGNDTPAQPGQVCEPTVAQVPRDWGPHSISTTGTLFPPVGAGGSGPVWTQRMRRAGRREQGQRAAGAAPAQGSGR